MDVPKPTAEIARKRTGRRISAVVALVAAAVVLYGVSRIGRAAPAIDSTGLWIGQVEEGSMKREVRGVGELVPDDDAARWASAELDGRIDRKFLEAGARVSAETVLLQMSNPDVEQAAVAADLALDAAKSAYASLEAALQNDVLAQRSAAAAIEADRAQAAIQAEVDASLARDGLLSEITSKQSTVRVDALTARARIERDRLDTTERSISTRLAVQRSEIENRQTVAALKHRDLEALNVRAGMAGVLQELAVDVGQRVTRSTNLARIVDPSRLKGVVRIPEAQTQDLAVGLAVQIDTHSGLVPGRVSRVAPAAQNGTVTVDVELLGALPAGARTNMTVDGVVELEHLPRVRHMPRPVTASQSGGAMALFRLTGDGARAERVNVTLGRSSATDVEIVSGGLQPGDRVVLSDTTAWGDRPIVRLR